MQENNLQASSEQIDVTYLNVSLQFVVVGVEGVLLLVAALVRLEEVVGHLDLQQVVQHVDLGPVKTVFKHMDDFTGERSYKIQKDVCPTAEGSSTCRAKRGE